MSDSDNEDYKGEFYSAAEVAKHASEESLWVIINDIVYDVTDYWRQHPGGGHYILDNAGQDITDLFESPVNHDNKIPMFVARNYEIGRLKDIDLDDKDGDGGAGSGPGGDTTGKISDRMLRYNLKDTDIRLIKKQFDLAIEISGGLLQTGIVIYERLLQSVDSKGKRGLFLTPKKVMAFQFVRALERLINHIDNESWLQVELYNLGMRHLQYASIESAYLLRQGILESVTEGIRQILEEEYQDSHDIIWMKFLNYIGWNMVNKMEEYGAKVRLVRSSWEEADSLKDQGSNTGGFGDALFFNLSVMSSEIFSLFSVPKEIAAKNFTDSFKMIVNCISNPTTLAEELFILSARHMRYGVQSHQFPVFGSAVMVTLRSLLPQTWNRAHEEAWQWLWSTVSDQMTTALQSAHRYKTILDRSYEKLQHVDHVELGYQFQQNFFSMSTAVQGYFNKPNATLKFIIMRAIDLLVNVYHTPYETTKEIRALGVGHIKYDTPPDYFVFFGEALYKTLEHMLGGNTNQDGTGDGFWEEETKLAWTAVFEFMSRCMARALYGGTTLITRALIRNSVKECSEALDQAPRAERNLWMLEVDVSGTKVSPFYWGIQDAKYKVCEFMLTEILSIRADRNKYYCGKDDLFRIHPDLIPVCCRTNKDLLFVLFDGLMWESGKVISGKRRVNYYIKDVYGSPDDERFYNVYQTPLMNLIELYDDEIFTHPLIIFVLQIQWTLFGRNMFLKHQLIYILNAIVFMLGYILLDRSVDVQLGSVQGDSNTAFVFRVINCIVAAGILFLLQIPRIIKEFKLGQVYRMNVTNSFQLKIPLFFLKVFNVGRWALNFLTIASMFLDQNLSLVDENNQKVISARSWTIALSCILTWINLFHAWEVSLKLLKLRQRCTMLAKDFGIFLISAIFIVYTFSAAIWLSEPSEGFGRTSEEFSTMWNAMLSLFATLTGVFHYRAQNYTSQMFCFYVAFCLMTFFVLVRLLYGLFVVKSIKIDSKLDGYTMLSRGGTLVELASMSKLGERQKIWRALNLGSKIEFDEGDLGISGGVQVLEVVALTVNQRHVGDRVIRYAGACGDYLPIDFQLLHLSRYAGACGNYLPWIFIQYPLRYAGACGDWLPWPKRDVQSDTADETVNRIDMLVENFRREFKTLRTVMLQKQEEATSMMQPLGEDD